MQYMLIICLLTVKTKMGDADQHSAGQGRGAALFLFFCHLVIFTLCFAVCTLILTPLILLCIILRFDKLSRVWPEL